MTVARHAFRLVVREPRRSLAAVVGVAIASALLTSVLLFGAASGSTVTRRALAELAVDAQVVLAPGADAQATSATVSADPAVSAVSPFALAHFDAAAMSASGTATQTSIGVLVGIDPAYPTMTGLFTLSSGSLAPGQIAISRDLASNLGAVPGDSIDFTLPGGAVVSLKVSGIVSTAGADLILGPIDAAHRAAGANPPANVAIMGRDDLEASVLPRIPTGAVAADPASASGQVGSATPVFVNDPAVRRELHVRLDHAQLPGDPIAAQAWLDTVRHRVERRGAGTFSWVDDAGASLEPLAADLAWGQVLFIFLALPGIFLALALSRLAADATSDSTRRHAGLLRARGAGRRELLAIFLGAVFLTALAGAVAGVVIGTAIAMAAFERDLAAADLGGSVARAAIVAIGVTTALASLAAILPLRQQLREEVALSRQELQRSSSPLWQRSYVDILALLAGGLVYVLAGGTGVHPVLNAEGNPTVTLALTSFVAPLLFWTGGTLLLLRLVNVALRRSKRLVRVLGGMFGAGGEIAASTLRARSAAASRAIVVLALAVGFATSVLVFDATYLQQQRVDAQLTLGADLKAVPNRPASTAAVANLAGSGVVSATPFLERVVYVGPEAQDLLAVDSSTLPSVSPLADTFFSGSTAAGAMAALGARPDAILVSAETAKDYSVVPGDRMRIRVPDASGRLVPVEFTMAGIALEFPTAPKDAFLVANLAYVAGQTGDGNISFVLARTSVDPGQAAAIVARRLGPNWQVSDLGSTSGRVANSITSVDLSTLVALDIVFAVVIAAVGVSLFLLAGIADRRRELATLIAIGAEPRQVRASLLAETMTVGATGLAMGLLIGGLVGVSLLQILAGVFDPPADVPAIPWGLIATITGLIALTLVGAMAMANRRVASLSVVEALRER